MMQDILLSIHPRHFFAIMQGEKTFEYRRAMPAKRVGKIVFYVTAPIKQAKGYAIVDEVLTDTVDGLWERTGHASGLSEEEYREYFSGLDTASAFALSEPGRCNPVPLWYFGVSSPPQSFQYIHGIDISRMHGSYAYLLPTPPTKTN